MEISIGLCEEDAFDSETWKAQLYYDWNNTAMVAHEFIHFINACFHHNIIVEKTSGAIL